ncbi:MAG: YihY/virulence factor BrkB family protein [Anaerolineales bacterium]|jgi:membrane protein
MKDEPKIKLFIKEIYNSWITDRPARLAAGLAYYGMFSLAPITYIALTIAGIFLDEMAMADRLYTALKNVIGSDAAAFIQDTVLSLEQSTSRGTFISSLISFIALLLAASGVFFNLQTSLNTIWHVAPPEKGGTLAFIKDRLVSFVMVIAVGLLLVVAGTAGIIISFVGSFIPYDFTTPVVNLFTFMLLAIVSISLIYKILPDAKVAWRDVWLGAVITTVMMIVGAFIFGWYLTSSRVNSAFEAAGTVAVILIGINVLAQIFLFGALFTRVYANTFGSLASKRADDSPAEGVS